MSKHIIDWQDVYKNTLASQSKEYFEYWKELSKLFGNRPIDEFDLMLYALSKSSYNRAALYVNSILPIKIPRGDYFTKVNYNLSLSELLAYIRQSTYSHTVYTYACIRLVMSFSGFRIPDWINCKICHYRNGLLLGVELPKWLKIIVERQIALAYKFGLRDDDPLLFTQRWNGIKKTSLNVRSLQKSDLEVLQFNIAFSTLSGKTFRKTVSDYIYCAGLNSVSMIQSSIRKAEILRFDLKNHLVGIYSYKKNNKLTMYDFGYCLYEPERGIYLINGTKGIYLVPYYLITQPVIRRDRDKDQKFKVQLPDLGYANADFYGSILTHKQLIQHEVEPHKLNVTH